jgi:hypothetical protein
MLDAVQGRDTSVRDTISKGRLVQGAQHPRIFSRGHIGRGHINPVKVCSGERGENCFSFGWKLAAHCFHSTLWKSLQKFDSWRE